MSLKPSPPAAAKPLTSLKRLLDAAVVALRRDQRFAGIPLREFELLLADVSKEFERRLFNQLVDRVHLDHVDVVDGVAP
jgi:hypothetical protein